jgi:shikimate kinase
MDNIVLIGYQGVGKTFFGKKLAEELGFDFIDIDEEMEKRDLLGRTNRQIFLGDGEVLFRRVEKEVLLSFVGRVDCVISCGGGVVEVPKAKEVLSKFKKVIYLYADLKVLKPRFKRPRIFLKDLSIEEAFNRRDALYRECCTEIIEGTWDQIRLVNCLQ